MLADALADAGDRRAHSFLPEIASIWPASAAVIEAVVAYRSGEQEMALAALGRAVAGFRVDPWNYWKIMNRGLAFSLEMARAEPRLAGRIFELNAEPFSVSILEAERIHTLVALATLIDCRHGERALAQFEPNVPLAEWILRYRSECYAQTGNTLARRARRDLEAFLEDGGTGQPAVVRSP
jgi:hypothetical protein